MTFEEFKDNLKLEGTVLDRRRKLTKDQVKEIQYLYTHENYSRADLAKKFNVTQGAIYWHTDIFVKDFNKASHKKRYYALDVNTKYNNQVKYKESYENYKRDLYNTLVKNGG